MNETQRSKDIARAALLREAVLGALRAAPAPMTVAELCGMSGIATLYHKQILPNKVSAQCINLVHNKLVNKVARGQYELNRKTTAVERVQAAAEAGLARAVPGPLQDLRLEVRKSEKSVTFVFEGLRITVQVLP